MKLLEIRNSSKQEIYSFYKTFFKTVKISLNKDLVRQLAYVTLLFVSISALLLFSLFVFVGTVNAQNISDPITENGYRGIFSLLNPIFNDFVLNTSDMTGLSKLGGIINFSNPLALSATLKSGKNYASTINISSSFMLVSLAILIVLIGIKAFNFLIQDKPIEIKKEILKIIYTVIFLLIIPPIASLSISFFNALTHYIYFISGATNASLSDIVNVNFLDQLASTSTDVSSVVTGASLFAPILAIFPMFVNLLANPQVHFALLGVILLILFIIFQFIIRFVNLYFLLVIYPFVVIYNYMTDKNDAIKSYMKIILTFLIQQPVFAISFVIIINLSKGLFMDGVDKYNPANYIILIGFLVFAAGANVLASKVFGDVFVAVAANIESMGATAFAYEKIGKPIQSFQNTVGKTLDTGLTQSAESGIKRLFGDKGGDMILNIGNKENITQIQPNGDLNGVGVNNLLNKSNNTRNFSSGTLNVTENTTANTVNVRDGLLKSKNPSRRIEKVQNINSFNETNN